MPRPDRPVSAPPVAPSDDRTGPPPSGARRSGLAAELVAESPERWRLELEGMSVPGIVYCSARLLGQIEDEALRQVANVAHLPGIVEASYAMPDVHSGYGFPIGGVAATDVERGGVVSPGGVGFDISCGVRLLITPLRDDEIAPRLPAVMDALDARIPRGLGAGGIWRPGPGRPFDAVLRDGAAAAVRAGFGDDEDLAHCEDHGRLTDADPSQIGDRALERGARQLGSLGAGNHFLEVQVVDTIFDEATASAFGLVRGGVCVMIHTGSRGLGHQVCSDQVHAMLGAMARHRISLPDRQLACAPVASPEGQAYLGAMAAATNFGRANRQVLTDAARHAFAETIGTTGLRVCYDVSHNLAKLERHEVAGEQRLLCVHRKGATLALPPGHHDLPTEHAPHGQPVLVPGSMGSASYVLAGVAHGGAFSSACHGAGRALSRHAARRAVCAEELRRQLERDRIDVRARSVRGLVEEAPIAYKDVDEVVTTCDHAGLARRVARLRPIGVVKG